MPRSLTGRIVLVVVLPILAAWLAMGLTLTVILGNLHADATKSSLGDIGQTLIARFRTPSSIATFGRSSGRCRTPWPAPTSASRCCVPTGRYVDLGATGGPAVPVGPITIPPGAVRGATITGSAPFTDGQSHLYAATVLRPAGAAGPRAVVLSLPDRSRAAAIADLVRTLPLVILLSAVVGLPLVVLLSRSVGGPLRRLAEATADLPVRSGHDPLPLEGPSEVRELTARFNAMAGELTDARQRETELLADLRHDLRTPLTVIGGYAAALADGTATGPDAERAARTIGEEAARLERLVDELGAVERLRQGADGLRPEPLDANEIVLSSAARFDSAAVAAGVELTVIRGRSESTGPRTRPRARTRWPSSPTAAPSSGSWPTWSTTPWRPPRPGGHVWLSATAGPSRAEGTAESVVLAVTDDGPGFPPGTAAHVFERFYRADPARTGPGSGLGLAIVRELATAHGGTVHAENVAPHGARVSVVLPTVPAAR